MTPFWTGVIVGVVLGGFTSFLVIAMVMMRRNRDKDSDCYAKIGRGGTD